MRSMIPFARAGYLVFASNYRGNHGSEGREEFGGADLADIAALLALASAHPGFDGKNRFMLGHSRGGMMTYLAIRHGMPINAAVSIAGIADLFAQEHWMGDKVFSRLIPGYPEGREEALAARSALHWPERLNRPLLLLHGTADEAVPHAQSERLAALAPSCELALYAQGNHALVRHWDEVLARALGWMEGHRQ
jgi:dipeptidyl aminopeptidase/acylaminoacyl peptidase